MGGKTEENEKSRCHGKGKILGFHYPLNTNLKTQGQHRVSGTSGFSFLIFFSLLSKTFSPVRKLLFLPNEVDVFLFSQVKIQF